MGNCEYGFVVTWSRTDRSYVAICFEFPGLSAFGATAEDALREAQVALELFIENYEENGEPLPEPGTTLAYPGNPQAQTYAELVSPAQLIEIRRLERRLDIDTETECIAAFKCKVEDLSRKAASVFILQLRNKKLLPRAA
ncbi:MAG: type II toxin-antitoxin system HicB family antitoxin [Pyrinomonadaceae bacterium MAG19_C2-C3]|nr:type II toxin-antitoxin system HicB family antitoxin [Pyrinomonadaceae bacterium MAG19_C2-C3]